MNNNNNKKNQIGSSADRSQSVGPAPSEGSPKRQVRSGSAAPATASTKVTKKTPVSTPTIVERRPRPSK